MSINIYPIFLDVCGGGIGPRFTKVKALQKKKIAKTFEEGVRKLNSKERNEKCTKR